MPTGDARRRLVMEKNEAWEEERRLAAELDGLIASIAEIRRMPSLHERAVRLSWAEQRARHVAHDLGRVRGRLRCIQIDLAEMTP